MAEERMQQRKKRTKGGRGGEPWGQGSRDRKRGWRGRGVCVCVLGGKRQHEKGREEEGGSKVGQN